MGEIVKVVIPTIGESIQEGTIGRWFFKEGDLVKKDQPLLEVDSDKATLEVAASASGRLKILVDAGKTAQVGSEVGLIEAVAGAAAEAATGTNGKSKKEAAAAAEAKKSAAVAPATTSAATPAPAAPVSTDDPDLAFVSPSKRKAIRHGAPLPATDGSVALPEVRKPMTSLRKRIAERLIESQQSTATLTTFNEIDMSNAMNVRSELKDKFEKQYGVKLGFMSLFAKAVIYALNEFPDVNARIDGEDVVYPQFSNLGIAVSTDRGLVVPVLKNAQNMTFSQLEKSILELAEKARTGKLQIAEMQGGTFTITNGGVFGSLLSTPIINPPQSGILGMHKIENRPIAIETQKGKFDVQVRPMMYVALSYDHRLIDGATSVGFLVKVKEYLEKVLTSSHVMS